MKKLNDKNDLEKNKIELIELSTRYFGYVKLFIAVVLVIIFMFLYLIYKSTTTQEPKLTDNSTNNPTTISAVDENATTVVTVYIAGEITKPDVYELPEGSRIDDLVNLAGGFTDSAYIKDINLAKKLYDEDYIYIYSNEEITSPTYESLENGELLVNINLATKDELMRINGIGEVTAQNIISYREEIDRFSDIEEIKNISGIGDKTFDKLKDYITVR
ncbi:MAG: helix-hairpin-helix domain-containing protein [Lachnospirales bacterium]